EPPDVLAQDAQMKTVMWALEKLSCEQREVIVLHLQGDMKFREIAAMLDMSINSVQSRYRYGIERLRQVLTKKEAI
ncbi:MAG: RNA polymerase sigma factor, partial [Planctomycetota bacterium]